MRSLPMALARAALAHGLEVHNYYTPPRYVEVFIPEQVAGCMMRGSSKKVVHFLKQLDSGALGVAESEQLSKELEVHHIGKVPKLGAVMAVCFPDWQFEPEGDA